MVVWTFNYTKPFIIDHNWGNVARFYIKALGSSMAIMHLVHLLCYAELLIGIAYVATYID